MKSQLGVDQSNINLASLAEDGSNEFHYQASESKLQDDDFGEPSSPDKLFTKNKKLKSQSRRKRDQQRTQIMKNLKGSLKESEIQENNKRKQIQTKENLPDNFLKNSKIIIEDQSSKEDEQNMKEITIIQVKSKKNEQDENLQLGIGSENQKQEKDLTSNNTMAIKMYEIQQSGQRVLKKSSNQEILSQQASIREQSLQNDEKQIQEEHTKEQDNQNVSAFGMEQIYSYLKVEEQVSLNFKVASNYFNTFRTKYEISFAQNDQFFFSVKMAANNFNTTYIASQCKKDFTENGQDYVGKYKTNFLGNKINMYGPGYNPDNAQHKQFPLRTLLATVEYETNFFGSTRPRNFTVYILKEGVDYYKDLIGTRMFEEEVALSDLYLNYEQNKKFIHVLVNKQPQWNHKIKRYSLNFGNQVKEGSVKNFILCDQDQKKTRMIFGKCGKDKYVMNFGYPLNTFIGVGICISAFSPKFGCE